MTRTTIFVVSVKINFCQRQTKCIDDQYKFKSVKDTDNEFIECQTPRKKLQSMKTLKSSIWDCVKDSESDSSDKNESESE